MKIITEHVYPPIPTREFDWSAVSDNYEPGAPIGWGKTEADAIADLRDQMEDSTMTKQAAHPRIPGDVSPERFARLTAHLRVNGKPVENILHRLQEERRGDARSELAPSS
jgi:hypothetical protein